MGLRPSPGGRSFLERKEAKELFRFLINQRLQEEFLDMNLSRKWLNEFVEIDAGDKEFAEAMTLSGSKVELTHDMGAEIQNVVVGRIEKMERHENSEIGRASCRERV